MMNEYNPFKRKEYRKTEHGIINYQHNMGTCYVTHRRKEHFFKKYNGFAISNSELEIAYSERVYWIVILYDKDDGTTIPYRLKMENTKYLGMYDNEGDEQTIFPLKVLEVVK